MSRNDQKKKKENGRTPWKSGGLSQKRKEKWAGRSTLHPAHGKGRATKQERGPAAPDHAPPPGDQAAARRPSNRSLPPKSAAPSSLSCAHLPIVCLCQPSAEHQGAQGRLGRACRVPRHCLGPALLSPCLPSIQTAYRERGEGATFALHLIWLLSVINFRVLCHVCALEGLYTEK